MMSRRVVLPLLVVLCWVVLGCRPPSQPAEVDQGVGQVEPDASPTADPSPTDEHDPAAAREPIATPDAPVMTCGAAAGASLPEPTAPPGPAEPSAPASSSSTTSSPITAGFPQHDPLREVTLWGKVRQSDAPVSVPSQQTGTWTEANGRLAPLPAGEPVEQAWFPRSAAAHLGDGLVRMRVELRGTIDVSLLLRQDYRDEAPRVLSGYGLSIEANIVRLYRWDRGMMLPIGPEAKLGKLDRRKSLEVVVMMVGPQLLANVYDGDTLEHLVSAAVHDTTYAFGCVGLRVGERHDPESSFTLLSAMDASQHAARTHLRDADVGQRYGVLPPSDLTPFGNTRYAWIRAEDLAELPKSLRKQLEAKVDDPEGERALLFLDTVGYERLLRSGVEVLAVDSNAPWSAFDPAFRRRASEPPTKRGRGFVLDDSYKDPALVEQLLRAYHERYPSITSLIEIGRTHKDRPIWALRISDADPDPDEPALLLNAAHHGSELLSIEYVLDAIDTLLADYEHDPRVTAWVDGLEVWCVPLVNVDGNHMFVHESRFAIRKNAFDGDGDGFSDPFEGVDLNRNYPFGWGETGSSDMPMHKWYRGPAPGSEPETRAMMELAERERFAAVLSFHTFGTDVYSPYGVPGKQNPKPDIAKAIGQEIAAAAPEQPNGRSYAVRKGGYPVAGSDQDWHLHAHGSIAFVIEGSHHNPPLDVRTQAVEATRPLWQALLDRVLLGPWIGGHVRDSAGNPVEATVMIAEHQVLEGERWTTRSRDGRFDRAVLEPGTYTLTIEADGRAAIEREVKVRSRRVELDIVLPDA